MGGENGEGAWRELNFCPAPRPAPHRGRSWETCFLRGYTSPVLTEPAQPPHHLVPLLLLDLLHLLDQLLHTQVQLSQLVFGCQFCIIIGVFTQLPVQVNILGTGEPGEGVRELSSMYLPETQLPHPSLGLTLQFSSLYSLTGELTLP